MEVQAKQLDVRGWVVTDDGNKSIHVVPSCGAVHRLGESCWCSPSVLRHEGSVPVVVHRLEA